jgi:hypothetical protein
VDAERRVEAEEKRQEQAAQERREERAETDDLDIEGAAITPFRQDVHDALDRINVGDVIKRHASDAYDTGRSTEQKTEFDPSWRTSSSGSSCVVYHRKNTFADPSVNGGGYPAKAMALGERIITDASAGLDGEEWGKAVDVLRDAGYSVPIWIPESGSTKQSGGAYEKTPLWALRKAAVVLGILPPDAFK